MEVELVFPITTTVSDTNGDSAISTENAIPSVSIEEKEQHANGSSATNEVTMATTVLNKEEMSMESTDGDDKMEPNTPISRSASSHDHRQAKKRGAFGLFRAMFMSFSGNGSMKKRYTMSESDQKKAGDKPAATAVSNDATWKNLVDGIRPLRLHGQLEYYPPPPPLGHDVYHDVLLPPPSPARSEGMTSRYASAQDLQQLDNGHEEEEGESAPTEGGDGDCPHAIDMQAEEFIAKFYAQFRLQKSESFNNRAQ